MRLVFPFIVERAGRAAELRVFALISTTESVPTLSLFDFGNLFYFRRM